MKNPLYILLAALALAAVALLSILGAMAAVTKDPALIKLVVEDLQQGLLWILSVAGPLFVLVDKIAQRAAGLPANPGSDPAPQQLPQPE